MGNPRAFGRPQSLARNLAVSSGGWITFERRVERLSGTFFSTLEDGGPSPRGAGALVYVFERGTIVLAGGEVTDAVNSTRENDLWEYDGVTWRRLLASETEAAVGRTYAALAYDRANRRLVRFGGTPIAFAQSGTDYSWFLSGQTWTLQIPDVPVLTRQPSPTLICPDSTVELVVESSRSAFDQYRWRRDGIEIDPAVNPTAATAVLRLAHDDPRAAGFFDCLVRSCCGTTISASVPVTVLACCCPADFNADGFLDFFDYAAIVEAFEIGC